MLLLRRYSAVASKTTYTSDEHPSNFLIIERALECSIERFQQAHLVRAQLIVFRQIQKLVAHSIIFIDQDEQLREKVVMSTKYELSIR